MRLLVRFWMALTTTAVVWLVAAPAFASAPQCDERGAITFAPNPKLEEPVSSLEVVATECPHAIDTNVGYEQGRSGEIDLDFSVCPATVPPGAKLPARDFMIQAAARAGDAPIANPSRDRLDRPPR
jgi:hypothetical protein